ncbi:MAG: hypothetical protein J6I76_21685 [Oribacterium sp.]|nr:hypothetical protein [Oribacterium sp.]
MNYRDEQEIDLLDLCRQILKKWKLIIAFALIGLVIGSAVGYVKSAKVVEVETGETVVDQAAVTSGINSLKEKLSDREVTEVEMAVNAYNYYNKLYANKEKYINSSIRMQLDADKVPTMVASYRISNYYKVSYPDISEVNDINNIIAVYYKALNDEKVIAKVAKALGDGVAENYVKELYSVGLEANSILNITVTARNEEECKKVLDVLTQELDAQIPTATDLYEHDIEYLNTYFSVNVNTGILSEQQTQVDALKNLQNVMLTVGNSLTADQKALYTKLIDGDTVDETEVTEVEVQPEETEVVETEKTVVRSFDIKYAVLGLFAGAFIVILFICLKYVLSQTIKTKEDISELFKASVLGIMKDGEDGELGMITAGIGLGAHKTELKKLYAISTIGDATVAAITNKVVDAVKQNYSELNVECGKSVLTDPSSLAKLAESDGIIMVEKLRTSKYEDIAKELELAKNYGVKVLGCVVVE